MAVIFAFSVMNTPAKVILDRGREFANQKVERLLRELDVRVHFATTGQVLSHGTTERFLSTLGQQENLQY